MNVVLRVDASVPMGTGHVRRCLSLAQALAALGAHCRFLTRRTDVDTAALVAALGFEAMVVDPTPADAAVDPTPADAAARGGPHAAWLPGGEDLDAEVTCARLSRCAVDLVVVDHYAIGAAWHRRVAAALGARVAAVDDLADRPLAATWVVDPNPSDDPAAKFGPVLQAAQAGGPAPRLLAGPRHALLGPAYADALRARVGDQVHSIGIFMGGTDPAALTEVALRACREAAGFSGPVEVVSTSANPHLAALQALVERWPETTLSVDLPDLASFFARHDLQVGAGGGASWERCCIGAPTLALCGAGNQDAVVPQLARLGLAHTLPAGQAPTVQAVGQAVRALLADAPARAAQAARARACVDGLGATRTALALMAGTLAVRRARADDSARTHAWRNDPVTRRVSREGAEIPWSAHQAWLARALADPRRLLLVGQIGPRAVGVIRFDRLADESGAAEVSLYLDPALHGLGLGPCLLAAGEAAARDWAATWAPEGLRVVATVLDGNSGSQRLFAGAGYTPHPARSGTWLKAAVPAQAPTEVLEIPA